MWNINYNLLVEMNNEIQNLEGKTKLNFNETFSSFYEGMNYLGRSGNFNLEVDPFSKKPETIAMTMHKLLFFKKFSETNLKLKIRI